MPRIGALQDVEITGATGGDILAYNNSTEVWENKTLSEAGIQPTLTNPITGTGANGQVAFWNGTNSQTGNNGLFWDNTNKRLGVGTNAPNVTIDAIGNEFRFAATSGAINFYNTPGVNQHFNFINVRQDSDYIFKQNRGGAVNTTSLLIKGNTGNVGISTTNPQARLDVRAQGALSTDIAFRVRNSADTADIVEVRGDGIITLGPTGIATGNTTLNVRGNIVANSNSSAKVTVGTDASNWGIVEGFGNGLELRTANSYSTAGGRVFINPQTNSNIVNTVRGTGVQIWNTGGFERMRITDTGQVTIGATTAGARLDVRAQGALSTDIAFRVRNSADTANLLSVNGVGQLTSSVDANISGISIGKGSGSGSGNTIIGTSTGASFTTGSNNSFYGGSAGVNNTTGSANTFMGLSSGQNNTTAIDNCYFGTASGFNNTGSQNAFFGRNSGRFIADGVTSNTNSNNSVFLGRDTRANANSQTNQIVIGDSAIGLGSNTVVLGNTSIVRTALRGQTSVNTDTVNASAQLQIDSTTGGFLPPRMTNAQRLAIASPAVGLMVYCTDVVEGLYINKSTGWTFII
jgi:hypothetical protein